MTTIITIEQGGTGVQSVQEIKELLGLKQSAFLDKSNNVDDDSQDLLATAYSVNQLSKKISGGLDPTNIVPIEKGGTGADNKYDAIRNLGIENQTVVYPISVEKGGTGSINPEMALKNLGLDIPVPIEKGGTNATDALNALKNLGLDIPVPIEKGGTGATSLAELITNLNLNSFPINVFKEGDDLNKKNLSGIYVTPQQKLTNRLLNLPSEFSAGTSKFILFVLSSIDPFQSDPIDMENLENNTGFATQLIFSIDESNKNNDMNEVFIRTLKRGISDIGTTNVVWSVWTRLFSSKNITVSSGAPSGGKSGDIWIQYI